ncbi:2743_t:CDS:2, partial [Funneliformis caledonium]
MATFEKIEKELNDAKDGLNKTEEKLKEFEEGSKEKKIWDLEEKLDDGEERNEEQRKGSRQPPSGKSQQPSSSSGGTSSSTSGKTSGKQNMEAQSFNYGDFKYISILSAGENNKVLECEFYGKPIVLKCTALSKKPNCLDELLNEVEIYGVLAKLQGMYIPELLFYGDLANGMSFIMGLKFVGSTLYHHNINIWQKERALSVLKKIHDCKVLHNDIREENIL